jgi:hypothetical protein
MSETKEDKAERVRFLNEGFEKAGSGGKAKQKAPVKYIAVGAD